MLVQRYQGVRAKPLVFEPSHYEVRYMLYGFSPRFLHGSIPSFFTVRFTLFFGILDRVGQLSGCRERALALDKERPIGVLFDYWEKIFGGRLFGMGVVSGLSCRIKFGTNWSVFSQAGPVSDVDGV